MHQVRHKVAKLLEYLSEILLAGALRVLGDKWNLERVSCIHHTSQPSPHHPSLAPLSLNTFVFIYTLITLLDLWGNYKV